MLHPDLAKLLPRVSLDDWFTGKAVVVPLTPADLTAFALAVARAERERCAIVVHHGPRMSWGQDEPEYLAGRGDAAGALLSMPDPDWATPDPEAGE